MLAPMIGSETCPRCEKPLDLCVCSAIPTLSTKTHVLFLQHPQEPDVELGSARIAHLALPSSTLRVGLSWPNLKAALGRDEAVAARWAALYLGSGPKGAASHKASSPLLFVDKHGAPAAEQKPALDGIVVLDGTWSQAKTLWWRNAWLLKLRRAIVRPSRPSLYRELRKEPRRECLSTIETVAETLDALGEPKETGDGLRALFGELLRRYRGRPRRGADYHSG